MILIETLLMADNGKKMIFFVHQSIQENKIAFFKDKIRFSTTEALRNDNFNIEKYNPVTFTVNVDVSIGNNENRRIG